MIKLMTKNPLLVQWPRLLNLFSIYLPVFIFKKMTKQVIITDDNNKQYNIQTHLVLFNRWELWWAFKKLLKTFLRTFIFIVIFNIMDKL